LPVIPIRFLFYGRPISSLRFATVEPWREMIDTIQFLFEPSTSRLRSLSVSGDVYRELCKHFPDLRLEFTDWDRSLVSTHFPTSFLSHTWSRNSPIRPHFWMHRPPFFDLELQYGIIRPDSHNQLYGME